jgi:hypothetical protein
MKPLVVDVDDLCDLHDPFDTLLCLKEADTNFKVTMFAIPNRCSRSLLKKYEKEHDWIRLGMHGWQHTLAECYSWNPREARDKIEHGVARGFDNAFRAPKWLITPIIYEVCGELGVPVADHVRHSIDPVPAGVSTYTYNKPNAPFKALHYHTWDTCGNGIKGVSKDLARFLKRGGHDYQFVSESACVSTPIE